MQFQELRLVSASCPYPPLQLTKEKDLVSETLRTRPPVWQTDIAGRGGSAALTTRHPSIHKSWHKISPTSGGRSFGIVRLRTKDHGCKILGFHGGDYEEWCLLGCYAVWLL
jgi:hypothetical protein